MNDERTERETVHHSSSTIQTCLVVRTDRIGDMVLTLPMARAIRKAAPLARVVFMVSEYTRPLVERAPDVDEIVIAKSEFRELVRQFREIKADTVFFPNSKFRTALAAYFARIPKRVGTAYRWYSFLYTDKIREHRHTALRNEAEYNLRMLAAIGVHADQNELPRISLRNEERNLVTNWLNENIGDSKYAVLHLGSGGSSKEWPSQRFLELSTILQKSGYKVVLSDQANPSDRTDRSDIVFVNRSLPELAALLSRASVVVANSTGPGHLAAALGTPTIGLFPLPKVLSKERWGFRGPHVKNLSPLPIENCPNCNVCTCMERLEVHDVMKGINELLAAQR